MYVQTFSKLTPSFAGNKKRPVWDYKGRLQDMESLMEGRESQFHQLSSRLNQLQSQKEELTTETSTEISSLHSDLKYV